MQQQLFPPEIIENSAESYLSGISTRSQVIYITILISVIAAMAALPFIRVDVSVQSAAIIRPVAERHEIRSLVSGTVAELSIRENQNVQPGQAILVLQTDVLDNKLRLNRHEQSGKQVFMADLEKLVRLKGDEKTGLHLASSLYSQQYSQLKAALYENTHLQKKLEKDIATAEQLYAQKAIARLELEDKQFELSKVRAEYSSLLHRQVSQWQSELSTHKLALAELRSKEGQLLKEKELYVIKSPVAGTAQQLAGKYTGSYVQAGEVLGLVSPDSMLVAECYVSPSDIGYVQKDMQANIQIDAFDYNEWGLLKGKVIDIARDFILLNNQPVFKVRCQLDQQYLQLKNGYKGNLKKGMTARTRLVVARRSLYQLLYDKADHWMNPYR